jgi:uncharacterized membrane protein YdjX (TVP38/TMEM64 family)
VLKFKSGILLLTIICIIATGIGVFLLGGIDRSQLQIWLEQMGILAPIAYIILYIIATILILPSTPLNMTGGAIFDLWWGTLWTTIAAVLAAIISFAFTRSVGRELIAKKLAGRWEAIDAEMRQGGLFYMFAIRLLPLIPYGIVNFAAGLTGIKFRDYLLGTVIGTVPGILPFVMMGAGLKELSSGRILPLMCALSLTGILVGGTTWYKRSRRSPQKKLQDFEKKRSRDL